MPRKYTYHKYSRELLEEVVARSKCWREVCEALDIPPATGSQSHLTRRAKQLGINSSHFIGQAWNKGRTFPLLRRPVEYYLFKGSTVRSPLLKKKLIQAGIKKEACEICGNTEWNNRKIPLELDHKNSDHWDNRLENLQLICPNCHAQVTSDRLKSASTPSGERLRLGRSETKVIVGSTPSSRTIIIRKKRPSKINWPPLEQLRIMLSESNYSRLGAKLGVSDNAIRKHIRVMGV